VVGTLDNAEVITDRTFWIGVYPGLTDDKIDYVIEVVREAVGASAPRKAARRTSPKQGTTKEQA
jgi:hypothetical protein